MAGEPLKTLKEMIVSTKDGLQQFAYVFDLRAEAIQLLGKNKNHHLFEKFAYEMENNEGIDVLDAAMDSESWGPQRLAEEYMNWLLKRFFNLTEKDLKDSFETCQHKRKIDVGTCVYSFPGMEECLDCGATHWKDKESVWRRT